MNSRKRQPSLTQTWSTSKKASNLIGSTEQPDVDPQQTTSRLRSDTEDVSFSQDVSIDWEVDTSLQTEKEMLQHIGEDQPDVDHTANHSSAQLDTEDTSSPQNVSSDRKRLNQFC